MRKVKIATSERFRYHDLSIGIVLVKMAHALKLSAFCLLVLLSCAPARAGVFDLLAPGRGLLQSGTAAKSPSPSPTSTSAQKLPPVTGLPTFSTSLGVALGGSVSIAQTGLRGECISQSVTAGTGATASVGGPGSGPTQSQVQGGAKGQSGCGDTKEPFQLGASFFNGFVVTGATQTGTVGGPSNCISNTVGGGRSSSIGRGGIPTSAGGGFSGSSLCG